MTRLEIELPKSMHERACARARQDEISLAELITMSLAEKLSAIDQLEYLKSRAKRGSRASFRLALDNVPDLPPMKCDEIPARLKRCARQSLQKLLARAPDAPPIPGDELPPGFKLPKRKRR